MTAILKKETRMDTQTKSYLQLYEEYIRGYKQYKVEKVVLCTKAAKT